MKPTHCRIATLLTMSLLIAGLAACEKKEGPAERAGQSIDKAIEKAGQHLEKAGENVQEAAKDARK